jgi:SSS family solute:Na+ symporter
MMKTSLPHGVLGLGVAAFVGTFISASNTMMMVVSATLTKDFYCSVFLKQPPSERRLLHVARAMTVAAGIGGVLFSFAVHDIVNLSVLALFLLLVLLPSVIGGFYWKRATATAALSSVLAGLIATFATASKLGTTAFVPGVIAASVMFVAVSFWTRHAPSEVVPSELGT